MEAIDLRIQFNNEVAQEISIEPEGNNCFRLFTPFMFSDGDHLAIALKKEGDKWLFTDEGDTFMHLSILGVKPEVLRYGVREGILSGILDEFAVVDRFGELILEIEDDNYAHSFYKFSQALLKISDLTYLTRDRVKETFLEDFKSLITEAIDIERCTFNWNDIDLDQSAKYSVDCRVNSMRTPLMVFALQNEQKTLRSIITINQLEKWRIPFFPIGIFKNEDEVSSKTIARFSDVCNKTFSNIEGDDIRERIICYLKELATVRN